MNIHYLSRYHEMNLIFEEISLHFSIHVYLKWVTLLYYDYIIFTYVRINLIYISINAILFHELLLL